MADEKKSKTAKAPAKPDKGVKSEKSKAGKPEKAKAAKGGRGAGAPAESVRGAVSQDRPSGPKGKPRLAKHYSDNVRTALMQKFGYKNVMQVPRLEKIVLNCGVGRATQQQSLLDGAVADLTLITGQKALVTRAKKSIAGFKLREGNAIGAKVTLRGDRMWEFYDRLVSITIPRIRDFRGLNPSSFDGRGNYTFGVTEQLIFPEIDYDKIDTVRGMDITIVTTGTTDDQGRALLRALGFPFRRDEQSQG